MAKSDVKPVDAYIEAQPAPVRAVLKRVRNVIRKALPGAEEVISYKIPAYKIGGRTALFFAGWTQHYSLYPAGGTVVAAFKAELAPFEVSKGTIRFPLSRPVPAKLIERIARHRARELTGSDKAKAAATTKRRRQDHG